MTVDRVPDVHGNRVRREGCDRCACGCKYWENDRCIDCGSTEPERDPQDAEDWAEATAWAAGERGFVDVMSDDDEHHDVWGSRGIGTREEMEAEGFGW